MRELIGTEVPPRLPGLPSVIVDSGRGFWLFYVLADPVPLSGREDAHEAGRRNRGVAQAWSEFLAERGLGLNVADDCHNVDRIARLPGSVNWPSDKKRAQGAEPRLATYESGGGDTYSLDQFPLADPPAATVLSEAGIDVGAVPAEPATRRPDEQGWIELLERADVDPAVIGLAIAGPQANLGQVYPSRHEWQHRVCCELERSGVDRAEHLALLLDERTAVGQAILTDGDGRPRGIDYARRQIRRAAEANAQANVLAPELGAGVADGNREVGFPELGTNGVIRPRSYENARHALGLLGIDFWQNTFLNRLMVENLPMQQFVGGEVTDDLCVALRDVVRHEFGFDPGKEPLMDAVISCCVANRRDPIQEQLDELQRRWDRRPRLETWLTTYLGVEDTPLHRAFGLLTLKAMTRRARQPGCKYDTILVLEGPQGAGKSTVPALLAGSADYFSDQPILAAQGREVAELVEGVWVYELAELEGIRRADAPKLKAFASRTHDRGRGAYRRFKDGQPRRCIFIATTNDAEYLHDTTGNRRFWPVTVGAVDLAALARDRDQLLGEAAALEAQGGTLVLDEGLWPDAEAAQVERVASDPWADEIALKLGDYIRRDAQGRPAVHSQVIMSEILQLPAAQKHAMYSTRVRRAMHGLGWHGPELLRIDGHRARGYWREAGQGDEPRELPF